MSTEGLIPFAKIVQGGIFPMTELVGQTAHDLPTLATSMKDLQVKINLHLTDMCNYWASVKAGSSDVKNVAGKGQERKSKKQWKTSVKKVKISSEEQV